VDVPAYIERLYAAFSAAPRPNLGEITPHRCLECDEVAGRLAPHDSRDVPDEDMYWLGDSLTLLGPKAFRYYLPRFIGFCSAHRDSSLDALINYNLAPSGPLDDEEERNRFAMFTPSEGQAVLEFVDYRLKLEDVGSDIQYLEQAAQYWRATPNKSLERARDR
jgi:hypothetical protein